MISLYFYVLFPIAVSVILYIFYNKTARILAFVLQAFFVLVSFANLVYVRNNGQITEIPGGYSRISGIVLKADSVSATMVFLCSLLFAVFHLYNFTSTYSSRLFVMLFFIMQGLVNGVFLSDDIFNIYVMVEASTIVISILIMFKKDSRSMYDGMIYLLANIVAMTFFLFGAGLLYKSFGVLNITYIKQNIANLDDTKTLLMPYAFLMTAAGLKSAILPLFSWLPKAHGTPGAPPVVSALLSGLYVKTGLFIFIRLQEMFSPVIDLKSFFIAAGILTGLAGSFLAICQTDIKLILAYSTISQLGLILTGLNSQSPISYWGSIFHVINHSFFKSSLFLSAGIIIEKYGTRDMRKIRGVSRTMPDIAFASIMAMLGVSGAPLFNGSISKYLIHKGFAGAIAEYGILIINFATVLYCIRLLSIFFDIDNISFAGNSYCKHENQEHITQTKRCFQQIDKYKSTAVMLMATVCLFGGLTGFYIVDLLFNLKVYIDVWWYLSKVAVYFATLLIGFFVYLKFIRRSNFINRVRQFDVGFNGICLSIVVFFVITLIAGLIKYN